MDNITQIEEGLIAEAKRIALPNELNGLFESQLSFWLTVQSIMRSSNYEQLRKRMPHISEELAEKISQASYREITQLCTSLISTLRPSLTDRTIIELLNKNTSQNKVLSALQLLAS